jgi:hypothetical protein
MTEKELCHNYLPNEFNIKFQVNAKLLCCLFSDMDVCEMKLRLLHKGASGEQPGHFPF